MSEEQTNEARLIMDSDMKELADAVRRMNGTDEKLKLEDMITIINNAPASETTFITGSQFNNILLNISGGTQYFQGFERTNSINTNDNNVILLSEPTSNYPLFGRIAPAAGQERSSFTAVSNPNTGQELKRVYTNLHYDSSNGKWYYDTYTKIYTGHTPSDESIIAEYGTAGSTVTFSNTVANDIKYIIQLYTIANKIYFNSDCAQMFYNCFNLKELNIEELKVDTSKVENMAYMFESCYLLDLSFMNDFDTSNVTNMRSTFENCQKLYTLDDDVTFNTENVTNMSRMFANYSNFYSGLMLYDNIPYYNNDTQQTLALRIIDKDINDMYKGAYNLDLSFMDTSKCTNMSEMFGGSYALNSIKLGGLFTTENVTDMRGMFAMPESINQNTPYHDYFTDNNDKTYTCDYYLTTIYVNNHFSTSKLIPIDNNFYYKMVEISNPVSAIGVDYLFYNNYSLVGGNGTQYNHDIEYHANIQPSGQAAPTDYIYARIDESGEPGYFTAIPQE